MMGNPREISFSEKAEAFRGFCCLFEGRGIFVSAQLYGDRIVLPNYVGIGLYYPGIVESQCKDPYKPISIMECHKGFERCLAGKFKQHG